MFFSSSLLFNYDILEIVNEGSFGKIVSGINKITQEEVIIKISPKSEINLLKNEAIIYNYIKKINGFPVLKNFLSDENYSYLVLSKLDKNLFELKKMYYTLTLKSVLQLGLQIFDRIKLLHSLKLLHRDIKPQNFMVGFGDKKNVIHIIDFGFCKKFVDDFGNHIELRNNREIVGTKDFISSNILNGIEPSRKDDIISSIYVLLFLFLEDNCWKKINLGDKLFNIECLYENCIIPKLFVDLLKYLYSLNFQDEPDYTFLENELKNFIQNKNWIVDNIFEWN